MSDINEILKSDKSWDDMRSEFGSYLGLVHPVPSAVLHKAITDEKYACYLAAAKDRPDYLKLLFNVPENIKEDKTNLTLLINGAKSLLKWGASGFGLVTEEVYLARMKACEGCEYLRESPGKAVYKVKLSKETDMRICSACGCVASRKARLKSETCPVVHPENNLLNKWNESIKDGE
ncbi:MAG TPA: hypothetical protein VF487_01185 [Chitinophagaceae bacterium]